MGHSQEGTPVPHLALLGRPQLPHCPKSATVPCTRVSAMGSLTPQLGRSWPFPPPLQPLGGSELIWWGNTIHSTLLTQNFSLLKSPQREVLTAMGK